jgi:hypothetical protein
MGQLDVGMSTLGKTAFAAGGCQTDWGAGGAHLHTCRACSSISESGLHLRLVVSTHMTCGYQYHHLLVRIGPLLCSVSSRCSAGPALSHPAVQCPVPTCSTLSHGYCPIILLRIQLYVAKVSRDSLQAYVGAMFCSTRYTYSPSRFTPAG